MSDDFRRCQAWLGFGSIGDFLDGVSAEVLASGLGNRPAVYLSPLSETAPMASSSLGSTTQYVLVQSILPDGIVAYVKVLTGRLTTNLGRPLDTTDGDKVNRRTDSLVAAIEKMCRLKDFRLVMGTLAMPDAYKYLTGDAGPAVYNAESDLYQLPTKVPVEVLKQ